MIPNSIDKIRRSRAEFMHSVAYAKESTISDFDDDLLELAESHIYRDTLNYNGCDDIDAFLESEADTTDDEIDRILDATSDITFDEMLGIDY